MCAVNGVTWEDLDVVKEMCKANISRGPDLTRFHVNSNLSLGHNLLAINCQDLSVAAQPRKSEAGSLLAYNGQLYDVDAEEELDTEFLHRNLDKHGTKFLRHINGAFAFAWLQGDVLHLVRDHFGCRPMFYATCEKGLIFSSTITGILATKEIDPEFSEENIEEFQRGNYWQNGPMTVYKNIHKIAPGQIMRYDIREKKILGFGSLWENYRIRKRKFNHFEYRTEVIQAIMRTSRSPQKVCLLQSGGLDSNLIASVLGVSHAENFFTATLAYTHNPKIDDNPAQSLMNEVAYARICAQEHNLDHRVYVLPGSQDLVDNYSRKAIEIAGSIFEDSYRMIPRLYLLEQVAQQEAKVILTGDGGDEVFSGYNKHALWMEGIDTPTRESVAWYIERHRLKEWFPLHVIEGTDPITAQMFIDLLTSAETYFLRADAFAGAYGMEARSPFVYQRLAKYVLELPVEQKFKYPNETFRGINKFLIREAFRDIIPEKIANRTQKIGWSLPYWRKDMKKQRNRLKIDQKLLEDIIGNG